jgi:hypothetical protein
MEGDNRVSDIVLPLSAGQVFARITSVSFAMDDASTEQVQRVAQPIGLQVATARTPSAFIAAAKIVKSPSVRAFNAVNFQ